MSTDPRACPAGKCTVCDGRKPPADVDRDRAYFVLGLTVGLRGAQTSLYPPLCAECLQLLDHALRIALGSTLTLGEPVVTS